jgi:hypothetical protein
MSKGTLEFSKPSPCRTRYFFFKDPEALARTGRILMVWGLKALAHWDGKRDRRVIQALILQNLFIFLAVYNRVKKPHRCTCLADNSVPCIPKPRWPIAGVG